MKKRIGHKAITNWLIILFIILIIDIFLYNSILIPSEAKRVVFNYIIINVMLIVVYVLAIILVLIGRKDDDNLF